MRSREFQSRLHRNPDRERGGSDPIHARTRLNHARTRIGSPKDTGIRIGARGPTGGSRRGPPREKREGGCPRPHPKREPSGRGGSGGLQDQARNPEATPYAKEAGNRSGTGRLRSGRARSPDRPSCVELRLVARSWCPAEPGHGDRVISRGPGRAPVKGAGSAGESGRTPVWHRKQQVAAVMTGIDKNPFLIAIDNDAGQTVRIRAVAWPERRVHREGGHIGEEEE